jgi:hypothetical protein
MVTPKSNNIGLSDYVTAKVNLVENSHPFVSAINAWMSIGDLVDNRNLLVHIQTQNTVISLTSLCHQYYSRHRHTARFFFM